MADKERPRDLWDVTTSTDAQIFPLVSGETMSSFYIRASGNDGGKVRIKCSGCGYRQARTYHADPSLVTFWCHCKDAK